MTTDKAARWLDLVAFLLQHRFPVTREEIFEAVASYGMTGGRARAEAPPADRESARRKFERDKDELRALGVEIETVELPQGEGDEASVGYRLRYSGFYLPYFELLESEEATDEPPRAPTGPHVPSRAPTGPHVPPRAPTGPHVPPRAPRAPTRPHAPSRPYSGLSQLSVTPDELSLLDRATRRLAERTELPLSAAAASARRKLAFDLPLSEAEVERVLAVPLPEGGRRALRVLQRAVAEQLTVRCRYYTLSRDAVEERDIEPWGLLFQRSHWYCVARARDRDAPRLFRVDRMSEARTLEGPKAMFEVPADFDVRAYLGRAPWELGEGAATNARVRFAFPQSRWVLNEGLGTPVEEMLEDGGAIVAFEVKDRAAFLRWLLTFRRQAEVLEPDEIATELEEMRKKVAELYEG